MNEKKRQLGAVAAFTVVVLSTGCESRTPPPTTPMPEPTPYERASLTRGGRLYDNWMKEKRVAAPAAANPGYALTQGTSTSVTATWRCNECHGWDYQGADGMNSTGSHYTGVMGVHHAKGDDPEELFEVIKNGIEGEAMTGYSSQDYTDGDVWDLVKFVKEGTVDLTGKFDDHGKPLGADAVAGRVLYEQGLPGSDSTQSCASCHGADGKKVNFHAAPQEPEYLGTVSDSPAQFTHHVRFGYAGGLTMLAFHDHGWSLQNVLDVLAHVQTLPTH